MGMLCAPALFLRGMVQCAEIGLVQAANQTKIWPNAILVRP
jgi:hypothetical protein